jgi:hypothetical protein
MLRAAEMPAGWHERFPQREDEDSWRSCLGEPAGLTGWAESSGFSSRNDASLHFLPTDGLQEVTQEAFVFADEAKARDFMVGLPALWECAAEGMKDQQYSYAPSTSSLRWPPTSGVVAAEFSYLMSLPTRGPLNDAWWVRRNQVAYRDGRIVIVVYHAGVAERPPLADTDYFLRKAIAKIPLEPPPDLGSPSPP